MITSVHIDGFKTLSEFRLNLNPGLNILVGPNGTGKTNIISFFEFLSHLIDRDPSEATSHLGGAGAVFRRVKDSYQPKITARVTGCYPLDEGRVRFASRKAREGGEKTFALYEYAFALLFSPEFESVVFANQQFRYRHLNRFVSAQEFPERGKDWDLDVEVTLENDMNVTTKVRCLKGAFVDLFPFFHGGKSSKPTEQAEEFLKRFCTSSTAIPSLLIRFSPAMLLLSDDMVGGQTYNIIPSRVKVLEDSAKPPGIASDGSGLSSTLYALRRQSLRREDPFWGFYSSGRAALKRPSLEVLKNYFQLANKAIQDVDVANDPFSNHLRVTFKIQNGDYVADVPLSLMSDGTLKWISLLTAALTASSVFSIEEPENYLHPQMQGEFVRIMREILFSERQHACTLMTTHSETLLNHCKPSELVVVSLRDGKTVPVRCSNEADLSDEIAKSGFGLGYYYIAGALQDE
jgi:predicted ATPase